MTDDSRQGGSEIAIVGMAAHLPGAATIMQYWQNLRQGLCAIRRLDEAALLAAGESPALIRRPDYVPAAAPLDGFEMFDAEFFGFSPKEAAILDPQHRQLLEVAWEALENAGHMPENFPGPVGVFAGCGMGSYFYFNICSNRALVEDVGMFLLRHTGNDKDFLSTRISHILDLKGPSIGVQTACSTSLVATHYACQALLNGECDMALAGGVTVELPQGRGYLYKEGEILSPDGQCHAFDHRAQGTVFGSGAGMVVLRRLEDALRDGDHIHAVIRGTAVNNDGAAKAGYLAPSVEGQAEAVAEAIAMAGVSADSIGYVECHGTGTYLGDPIEIAALSEAFARSTNARGFCRIGSVKTNIGHLDTAAGVASLIKAALTVQHGEIPPSLGYEAPNPAIDFAASPFVVNDRLTPWPAGDTPRRAGVNSLGVGGTNAYLVLEQPPAPAPREASDWPFQLLVLSGRNRAALDGNARALAAHLRAHPEQDLADIAWTLKQGRRAFEERRVLVAESHAEAAELLESGDPRRVFSHRLAGATPEVVFLFPGGGAQYPTMARDLYETEPVFRDWMDRGLDALQARLDTDIRALWLPEPGQEEAAAGRLRQPSLQLPLIMIVEYALAQLFISWGVRPAALVGHSMGENTAACLAGVMTFEECIGLVHLRGQLFDTVPAGGMLSVALEADALAPRLGGDLDIASINAPGLCVVSGPDAALDALAAELAAEAVETSRIAIDIAAHSRMLEPILGRFRAHLQSLNLKPPQIPVISNRSGQELSAAQATDPEYWVGHLRHMVRFADCIAHAAQPGNRVFLEVGPGKALTSLAGAHPAVAAGRAINALRHPDDPVADDAYFVTTLGRLWACGVAFDWAQIWGEARRCRVPLPGYAFQRAPYFIAPDTSASAAPQDRPIRIEALEDWGFRLHWRAVFADSPLTPDTPLPEAIAALPRQEWLIFVDDCGLGAQVAGLLRGAGHGVSEVRMGDGFARDAAGNYTLAPEQGRSGYDQLLADLMARGQQPGRIAHFWLVTGEERFRPGSNFADRNQAAGFFSLLFLAQAIEGEGLPRPLHCDLFTSGALQVIDEPLPYPEKALVLGPAGVIPREMPGLSLRLLDIPAPPPPPRRTRRTPPDSAALRPVLEELCAPPGNGIAAWRGARRYLRDVAPLPLPPVAAPYAAATLPALAPGAVWLITGGFGGIGLALAEHLIGTHGAKVALLGRSPLPPRDTWKSWPGKHGAHDPMARRILAVQRLEALGGEVLELAADVCNIEEMRTAITAATAHFGRIDGVVHAAGRVDDGPLLARSTAQAEQVLAPKLQGTQVLDALFPDGTLQALVLCSSTSTLTTPAGQADYVAANEYLNAYARARTGGRTRVLALNWGIWQGTGMAAEAIAARLGQTPALPEAPLDAPLLDMAGFDAGGHRRFTAQLDPQERWVLDEHRLLDGSAVLPGAAVPELATEALRAQGETGAFEIRDLSFLHPFQAPDGAARHLKLTLKRSDEGYDFTLENALGPEDPAPVVTAEARLRLMPMQPPAPCDLDAIAARCTGAQAVAPAGAALTARQAAHLAFGPRWQVLRRTALGTGEGLAELRLAPEFTAEAARFELHPALLDIATGWAMDLIPDYDGQSLWVPMSIARLCVYAPLGPEVTSWARLAGGDRASGVARFDITLCAADGTVLAEVEGFTIRRITGSAAGFAPPAPGTVIATAMTGSAPLSPSEERLAHNLSQGILPEEGAEAFVRAMATGLPQVVVSSLDVKALQRQAAITDSPAAMGQSFARPDLDSAHVAPRDETERRLAGFWEELLGVSGVGVEDSFFDLGGHSLIAVRLFARIRKAWNVDFPISVLFEAPTIARCAELIRAATGTDTESPATPPAAPARRFTHLVPMHDGEGGPHRPFFLVAGMFGNVLNLRHLAMLLGRDRPFYGLQARGLFGDATPHDDLCAAATDYIAEIRQVQPHGPYLLGGFSGGGLTAWEMARQLQAAGEEVALLALLDTPLPVRPVPGRADRLLMKWHDLRRRGPRYIAEWARARLEWELRKWRGRTGTASTEGEGAQFHNAEIEAAFRTAIARYGLTRRDGPVRLFRPPLDRHYPVTAGRWISREKEYVLEDNGWRDWANGLEVIEVPGDHDSMVLEPNVRVLAARLKDEIERAEETAGNRPPAQAAE